MRRQLDFEAIKTISPQRFPFLMLDRIVEIEPGVKAVGIKNLSGNEPMFQGHFPDKAIMPGAMICEALAQTAIVFFDQTLKRSRKGKRGKHAYYLGSMKIRFKQRVLPGDQLRLQITPLKIISSAAIVDAMAFVGSDVVAEGELSLAVKDDF